MKRLIIGLVVLVVLTVIAIPTYGRGGGNLRIIDANGRILGKVVGVESFRVEANVATTVGRELVILTVDRGSFRGTDIVRFKEDNCVGQGFIDGTSSALILTAIGGVENSVYKVLDRDPALFEAFLSGSVLFTSTTCINGSFSAVGMLPATLIGDLSEFVPPFEYFE